MNTVYDAGTHKQVRSFRKRTQRSYKMRGNSYYAVALLSHQTLNALYSTYFRVTGLKLSLTF